MATEAPWEQISRSHTVASVVDFFLIYMFGIFPLLDSTVERDRKYGERGSETGNCMPQKTLAEF